MDQRRLGATAAVTPGDAAGLAPFDTSLEVTGNPRGLQVNGQQNRRSDGGSCSSVFLFFRICFMRRGGVHSNPDMLQVPYRKWVVRFTDEVCVWRYILLKYHTIKRVACVFAGEVVREKLKHPRSRARTRARAHAILGRVLKWATMIISA